MAVCSEKMFGMNLEFTRHVGYGGLYAEMIYNGRIQNDAEGFYPVELEGMKGLGQYRERFNLLSNTPYEWKVLAGEKVVVRLLTEFDREFFRGEGESGTYIGTYNRPYSRIEVVSDAPIRYISFKQANHFHGCRIDVLDQIKALHPKTLRVPGGCYAEKYKWKEGLLPLEERPLISSDGKANLFSANCGYDGHELNIDDYAAVSRYIGAELEFTVRLTSNDPQDAADLVEYCNGDASTKYGALRIARGYEEPYNIKTWYIGNEVAFIGEAENAAEWNDRFCKAMLAVDPTIRTVVTTGNDETWDKRFLASVEHVDLCAYHNYIEEYIPDATLPIILRAVPDILLPKLERASAHYAHPILFDEWNLKWGCQADSTSAIYAASVLTAVIKNAERLHIEGVSYFAAINEGAVRVYPDHACLAPDGEVLARMSLHASGEILPTDDPAVLKTKHDGYTYISVYNDSAEAAKALPDICGVGELLLPDGVWMKKEAINGELNELPVGAIAFVKSME